MTFLDIPQKKTLEELGLDIFGQSKIRFSGGEINQKIPSLFEAGVPSNFIQDGDTIVRLNVIDGYLQSDGFVTGSSGWRIDSDGNVEFNNGTFRGNLAAGTIAIGTNGWHVDSSGNMWWGSSSTYAGATIKISSAGEINFTTGTFSGTLNAAGGTLGTITSGTIQGCTIQSTSGENKIELSTGDSLNFYYSSAVRGYIKAESTTDLTVSANDDVRFRSGGSVRCQVGSDSFRPTGTDRAYDLGTDANQWRNVYADRFFAGSSGTGGFVGPNSYGFITALRISGSAGRVDMDGKYREITFIGGIVTNVSAETDWVFLDSASGI